VTIVPDLIPNLTGAHVLLKQKANPRGAFFRFIENESGFKAQRSRVSALWSGSDRQRDIGDLLRHWNGVQRMLNRRKKSSGYRILCTRPHIDLKSRELALYPIFGCRAPNS